MVRKKQTSRKNNIVILCEGTDTEFNYFTEVGNYVMQRYPGRYSSIKVVPVSSEKIREKNLRNRKTRQLQDVPGYHYYCQWENSAEEYKKYRAMPTRFVRETQLYMERDGYVEGWAVFDKDVHPDHENAFALAGTVPNLHIAFSSYCFEEWLLAHFERNGQSYSRSECMATRYDSRHCGTGERTDDCHGTICLAGVLREKKYISTYSKTEAGLFGTYTLPRMEQACANAAWLRGLSDNPVLYERNPYTDVDKLVMRLLDREAVYEWHKSGEIFSYGGTKLSVLIENNSLILQNRGERACIVASDGWSFCRDKNQESVSLQILNKLLPPSVVSEEISIPKDFDLLRIADGNHIKIVDLIKE